MQFVTTENTQIHKQVQIYVDDGIDSLISTKGSGIQSAIVIGFFAYYCTFKHNNTSVLVVEEPEIYLHPQARRAISQRLDEFVHLSETRQNQVIVTTHTTEFVQSGDPATVTVVRKEKGETTVKTVSFSPSDLTESEIKVHQKAMRQQGAEMFFADTVILCEGAEVYLLPRIANLIHQNAGIFDDHNISVIRVDGKGNFLAYTQVLDKIGVPWFILADLDFFSSGLSKFGDKIDNKLYNQMLAEARVILDSHYEKEGAWVENKKINERLTQPTVSTDAKAFAQAMEIWEHNPSNQASLEAVFSIWQHIKPSLKKRLTRDVITSDETFCRRFDGYLVSLMSSNIWILREGELEDYVRRDAPEGNSLIEKSKVNDAKLLQICFESDADIKNYFKTDEFENFISAFLPPLATTDAPPTSPDLFQGVSTTNLNDDLPF
jgi:putative ATP-dependent endonuclease of the OLD family